MTSTSQKPARNHVSILGIPVDRISMKRAVEIILEFLRQDEPKIVITADSSGIVQALKDPEYFDLLQNADLVTPDSIGVIWAAKRKGRAIPGRVSGVDLVDKICGLSADHGFRIFLLGAAPGVAELAAEKLRLKHPGCHIVGTRHGYFPADDDDVVAREVTVFKPDVLLVAMGIPRQEKFIKRTQEIIRAKVAMGVGGSFDVFSGKTKRAPALVQKLRLEWMWRVLLNPKKIAKAKSLPVFAWKVLRSGK